MEASDALGFILLAAVLVGCIVAYRAFFAKPLARDIASGHAAAMGEIICPNQNCGYRGEPREEARGSVVAGLLLCCFFLLPGIIYFIMKSGHRRLCPKCGLQISVDN